MVSQTLCVTRIFGLLRRDGQSRESSCNLPRPRVDRRVLSDNTAFIRLSRKKHKTGRCIARGPGKDQAQDNDCEQDETNYEPQAAKHAAAMNGIRSFGGWVDCHRPIFTV